ncbi:MAG: molybdopterin-dependent oxidoreductase [Hyphomicrobiaceae bacterium]
MAAGKETPQVAEVVTGGTGLKHAISRRGVMLAGAGAAIHASSASAQRLASGHEGRELRLPLNLGDPREVVVQRPGFVKNVSRLVNLDPNNQGGAWWTYSTYVTPIEDFFVRNSYPTPRAENESRIHKDTWRLRIHGDAVERELTLTYNDLLKLPSQSIMSTLECAGNGRSMFWEQQGMTSEPTKVTGTGWGLGGIGLAEWQYVPMSQILALVGLKKSAKQALFWSGVDNKESKSGAAGDAGRPVPIETLILRGDACGLAFKMNGHDLPADHGAPVRAIIPGWCGAASTKWLTEIKISSKQFWVRLNTTQHVLIGPNYTPPKPEPGDEFRAASPDKILGQMVTWAPPRSLLTLPLVLEKQPRFPHNYPLDKGELPLLAAGKQKIRGYAWAPQHGVRDVHLRINGGQWQKVRFVDQAPNRYCWQRFTCEWNATAGEHILETRTTDKAGQMQPATVPFNQGGFDFWAIPKFRVRVV